MSGRLAAAQSDCIRAHCPQIAAATRLWDGTGTFLFTSSAGIYAVDDGGQVNEDSAVVGTGVSERNDRRGS